MLVKFGLLSCMHHILFFLVTCYAVLSSLADPWELLRFWGLCFQPMNFGVEDTNQPITVNLMVYLSALSTAFTRSRTPVSQRDYAFLALQLWWIADACYFNEWPVVSGGRGGADGRCASLSVLSRSFLPETSSEVFSDFPALYSQQARSPSYGIVCWASMCPAPSLIPSKLILLWVRSLGYARMSCSSFWQ